MGIYNLKNLRTGADTVDRVRIHASPTLGLRLDFCGYSLIFSIERNRRKEVMRMENKSFFEAFRSDEDSFDKNFADYLIGRYREGSTVKKCTFFRDDEKMKKWATCHFGQRS